jgi:hypothetical protein
MTKFITGHAAAVIKLREDVGSGNFRCYDIDSFMESPIPECYPSGYLAKCSHVTVAVSGDPQAGREWMVICPFRVDTSGTGGAKVYDIDPFVVTLDPITQAPTPSGCIAYHQDFTKRTSSISGFESLTKPETVTALRRQLVTGKATLEYVPEPVSYALNHMTGIFTKLL